MSVLTDASQYASSSRVRGIFRYLVKKKRQREERATLEEALSPQSLLRGGESENAPRAMIHGTISECLKMRLLVEEGSELLINPELPDEARDPHTGDELLPFTLARLMLTTENDANENLAIIIAWYIAQDAYHSPGTWPQVEANLTSQVGGERLGMTNNARYSQFVDWICFLGFAWRHALGGQMVMTPDPTAYLRRSLHYLFRQEEGDTLPLREFMARLGMICPVFEQGSFRERVESESRLAPRDRAQLSTVTALGLLRLQDEGLIELSKPSDADLFLLPEGDHPHRYSHIRRTGFDARGGE